MPRSQINVAGGQSFDNVYVGQYLYESTTSGITAGTTRTRAGATALTTGLNSVDTSTAVNAGTTLGDGVVLAASALGLIQTVVNNTANIIQVYSAGSDTINGVVGTTGVPLPPGDVAIFKCTATNKWFYDAGVGSSSGLEIMVAADSVAAAGANQAAATVLSAALNRVTTATANQGVRLPVAIGGLDIIVANHSGVSIIVYGGGTDKIDDVASATGVTMMDSSVVIFTAYGTGNWYSNGLATGYAKNAQGGSVLETMQPADAVAAAGTTQAGATQLLAAINTVSTVGAGSGVNLPASAPGLVITVINTGASALLVYPAQGASDTINGIAATLGVALLPNAIGVFNCTAAGAWTFSPSSPVESAFNTNSTAVSATLTAANISGGVASVTLSLTGTLGSAQNITLPTVAALQLALHGAASNTSYKLRIVNNSPANFAWTVLTNTGWTLAGNMVIPQGMYADYTLKFTTLSAATLQFESAGPIVSLPPSKFTTSASATAAAGDLTGAGVCHFIASGANALYTTRTAAQMFADIPNCYIGYSWTIFFRNTNASANTLTAADGSVTLTGTVTAAQNVTRMLAATFTTASAVTFQDMGVTTALA